MSDYMFMLESHLSADQSRVVGQVQSAAAEAGVNVFLTGGAMRDMLAGFPIMEIDFTVEGSAIKLAKSLASAHAVELLEADETGRFAKLSFAGKVRATLTMARQEKYLKPGAKPQVQAGTIHEDLRGRDFTINSIALSLNSASRGLLIDPNNGVGDIQNKELRAVTNYTLYDDPIRLLRLQRFKVRLGFTIGERTLHQYGNAREAGLETKISPAALLEELRKIGGEQNVAEVVRVLDEEKLLTLFSPALTGQKVNMAGLLKLQKVKQMVPFGTDFQVHDMDVFLNVFTEKLLPAEKEAFTAKLGMTEESAEQWQKLEARSKKLDRDLKTAALQKPSSLYKLLSKAQPDQILFLLLHSPERLVQDRIKNYLQKYLPAAQEITEGEILATGAEKGTAKYEKARIELVTARLDARPKKVVAPPVEEPPPLPPPPTHAFARRQ